VSYSGQTADRAIAPGPGSSPAALPCGPDCGDRAVAEGLAPAAPHTRTGPPASPGTPVSVTGPEGLGSTGCRGRGYFVGSNIACCAAPVATRLGAAHSAQPEGGIAVFPDSIGKKRTASGGTSFERTAVAVRNVRQPTPPGVLGPPRCFQTIGQATSLVAYGRNMAFRRHLHWPTLEKPDEGRRQARLVIDQVQRLARDREEQAE